MEKTQMNLFWATTRNGYEDCFVIAKTKGKAEDFHDVAEGFKPGDTKAKFVCNISKELINQFDIKEANWPSEALIAALGGKRIIKNAPSKVNINGKVYIEGTVSERMFFDYFGNLTGVYIIKIQDTNKYKIGRTINIKKRIKQFNTGNPENIKLEYFIETEHYLSLEKLLHEIFKNDKIGGEWYNFDDEKFKIVEATLFLLQSKGAPHFKVYNIKSLSIQAREY